MKFKIIETKYTTMSGNTECTYRIKYKRLIFWRYLYKQVKETELTGIYKEYWTENHYYNNKIITYSSRDKALAEVERQKRRHVVSKETTSEVIK